MERFEDAKENKSKTYLCYVYKRVDGEMQSKKVGIDDAVALIEVDGWRLSPAEFHKDESLTKDPAFHALCDDISKDRNMIANIESIEDPAAIEELLERLFGRKVRSDMKIQKMRKLVIKLAKEKGVIDENGD